MRLVSPKKTPDARTLAGSKSGVVFVEYVALLTLVTVIGSVAVVFIANLASREDQRTRGFCVVAGFTPA